MRIWSQPSHTSDQCAGLIGTDACIFCRTALRLLGREVEADRDPESIEIFLGPQWTNTRAVSFCPACGWWLAMETRYIVGLNERCRDWYGACAQLAQLDLDDVAQPLDEVRRYLLARYETRFDMHPRLLELAVADVFRGLGYAAHVTAYSNDGGIDAVLVSPAGGLVGVQVKRYRGSISVEQIRAFTGALFIGGYTRGVFVTTSAFQSGAGRTCGLAALRGMRVELMDAPRLYDALRITARPPYESLDEWRENVGDVELEYLEEEEI